MGLMNDVLAGMCFLLAAVVVCNHVRFAALWVVMLVTYVAAFFVVLDKFGLVAFAADGRSVAVAAAQFAGASLLLFLCCTAEKLAFGLYLRTFKRQRVPLQLADTMEPLPAATETTPVQTEAA